MIVTFQLVGDEVPNSGQYQAEPRPVSGRCHAPGNRIVQPELPSSAPLPVDPSWPQPLAKVPAVRVASRCATLRSSGAPGGQACRLPGPRRVRA